MAIEKIVVKIGDREIELTMDEARELWSELDQLFSAPKGSMGDLQMEFEKSLQMEFEKREFEKLMPRDPFRQYYVGDRVGYNPLEIT